VLDRLERPSDKEDRRQDDDDKRCEPPFLTVTAAQALWNFGPIGGSPAVVG
jgi:hypothetical protein